MSPKFRTNLMALAVALGTVVAGYGLGEPPTRPVAGANPSLALAASADADELAAEAARSSRIALKRQIAMPYVSMAALMPRQES